MNKNTIYALLLGTSLLSCDDRKDIGKKADGSKVLYIPAECKDIETLTSESYYGWSLTCKDENGKEFHYSKIRSDGPWVRYEIIRQ